MLIGDGCGRRAAVTVKALVRRRDTVLGTHRGGRSTGSRRRPIRPSLAGHGLLTGGGRNGTAAQRALVRPAADRLLLVRDVVVDELGRAAGGRLSILEHQHGAQGMRSRTAEATPATISRHMMSACGPVHVGSVDLWSALLIYVVASFVASTAVLPWDSVSTVCFSACTDGLGERR
jgi:hypothetical protein